MTSPSVEVKGLPELQRALSKVAEGAANMTPTHDAVGQSLAVDIAARTPIRTGLLASSWRVSAGPDRVTVQSDVRYALPVEFGARGLPGVGMVSGALEAQTPAITDAYTKALADAGRSAGFETKT